MNILLYAALVYLVMLAGVIAYKRSVEEEARLVEVRAQIRKRIDTLLCED